MNKIGKYVIIEELGRGGMGIVYKALDPDINRQVAIKLIRNELLSEGSQGDKMLRQFQIEARAAGRLSHPNIATIYEVGRQDDQTYIVMQYIQGRSLRKTMEAGKKYSVEDVVDLMGQVCRALDYAHQNGIVHRDIKPDNILLDEAGKPYLVDFGIATIESVNVTRTRTTSATPAYMSPEQILENIVDRRSDIFSLGVIIFELLSGQRPFLGENVPSVLNRIVNDDPAPLILRTGQLPEGFEEILHKSMAKKPEDRWTSAAELADALAECVHPLEQTTVIKDLKRTGFLSGSKVKKRKKKLFGTRTSVAVGIGAGALALVALLFLGRKLLGPEPQYENLISISPFVYKTKDIPGSLIEFVLDRSLTASTRIPVLTKDIDTLGDGDIKARQPIVRISGVVVPTLTGFEVDLTFFHRSVKKRKIFPCKGNLDFITFRIDEILRFLQDNSNGDIGPIEGNRTFAKICSSNWDAFSHFLKGQAAWAKLDTELAHAELKTTLEYDPDFSLARLKAAEVTFFRSDREEARSLAESAIQGSERLIGYDIQRLKALLARIDSKPSEERGYLMGLMEAFPLKKEYLYEFAESYFHAGDGGEAIPYYEKALALDNAYALAHNHIAFGYAWMGNHAKAEEHFRRYVDLDKTANSYDSMAAGFMFAGHTASALEALDKGLALDPKIDYLYGNYATNYHLVGALVKAEESLQKESDVSTRESTRFNILFNRAYIQSLRGDAAKAGELLRPALDYYGRPQFSARLDESPILPFWLEGVLAAGRQDSVRLRSIIAALKKRAEAKGVNATNYFPILKFLVHLEVLEAKLRKDPDAALRAIEIGERIENKMGYWTSPYNRAFFLDQFAQILLDLNPASSKPKELLNDALSYNEHYAPALLRLARILAGEGKNGEAKPFLVKAREVLAGADADSLIAGELLAVAKLVGD